MSVATRLLLSVVILSAYAVIGYAVGLLACMIAGLLVDLVRLLRAKAAEPSLLVAPAWRRAVAFWIDSGFALLLIVPWWVICVFCERWEIPKWFESLLGGFAMFSLLLVPWFFLAYKAFMEFRYGRTPGKRLLRIRVTNAEGGPLSPQAALIRNVFLLADLVPAGLVALLFMVANPLCQRFGDWAAQSYVGLAGEADISPPLKEV